MDGELPQRQRPLARTERQADRNPVVEAAEEFFGYIIPAHIVPARQVEPALQTVVGAHATRPALIPTQALRKAGIGDVPAENPKFNRRKPVKL